MVSAETGAFQLYDQHTGYHCHRNQTRWPLRRFHIGSAVHLITAANRFNWFAFITLTMLGGLGERRCHGCPRVRALRDVFMFLMVYRIRTPVNFVGVAVLVVVHRLMCWDSS